MHLGAAFRWFFKVLSEGEPAPAAPPPPPAPVFATSPDPAAQMLALLQKEGRLVDFLMEDIASFSDAEVGAAVREIHAGCRKAIRDHVTLERILLAEEGAAYTVEAGFDASRVSLVGSVSGAPPYRGEVRHRGWRAAELRLPTVPEKADPRVIAPAEVEVR
jgi:hypothetical protein